MPGLGRPRLDLPPLTLSPGLCVVVGPNGSGKSTLLRALLGLVDTDGGGARIDGAPVSSLPRRELAASLAWLPQIQLVESGLTAIDVVASCRYRFAEPWPRSEAAAVRALEAAAAGGLAARRVTELSGGEAQRVAIASMEAQEAAWWLLDEPGNHLDPAVRLELADRLAARAAGGGGVVLVTHDVALVPHLGQCRVIGLREGCLHLDLYHDDPGLASAVGRLFDLDVQAIPTDAGPRWVTLGRAP